MSLERTVDMSSGIWLSCTGSVLCMTGRKDRKRIGRRACFMASGDAVQQLQKEGFHNGFIEPL